jgi:cell division cycle 2-like protein
LTSSQKDVGTKFSLANLKKFPGFDNDEAPRTPPTTPQPNAPTMTTKMKSRWADDEDDAAAGAARKREKEEKKQAKAEKQRKADALLLQQQQVSTAVADAQAEQNQTELSNRPSKRRKLSPEREEEGKDAVGGEVKLLRFPVGQWKKCRSVEEYEKLNDIEEGAYGWVSRARDSATGQVVALKRLKMDNANDGIPVTGLREIQTLMDCEHPNIVALREVVVGEDTRKIEKYVILSI